MSVPEDVYLRVQQVADETAQPVERVIGDYLRALAAPVPALAPDEEAELDALRHLSDDALWTIVREKMPEPLAARMKILMNGNSGGTLTSDERAELEALVDRGQRLMVRKSEAGALLTQWGYRVERRI